MADPCNTPNFGLGAFNIVTSQFNLMNDRAQAAFDIAIDTMQDVGTEDSGVIAGITTVTNFATQFAGYTPFNKPEAPESPEIEYTINSPLPSDPSLLQPTEELDIGTAPDDDIGTVSISIPNRPEFQNLTVPGDAPTVNTPDIPDALVLNLPGRSDLLSITLPAVPNIDIDALRTRLADIVALMPELDDDFASLLSIDTTGDVHAQYLILKGRFDTFLQDRALETSINNTIEAMFAGLSGIAPAVEQDIYNRAADRENRAAILQEREAFQNWKALGYSMPGHGLVSALRQSGENRRSNLRDLNRDIRIRAQDVQIEQTRFATQQAITLRDQIRTDFTNLYGEARGIAVLSLQAQQFIADTRLAYFREQITSWRALLETLLSSIRIEEFALQEHAAQLGNQRLVSEINGQTIEQDNSLVEQEQRRIEARREEIRAIEAVIQAELAKLDGFEKEVRIVEAQARVQGEIFAAYRSAVDAETGKTQILSAKADVLESRTRAYQTRVQAADLVEQYKLRINDQRIEVFDRILNRYNVERTTEAQRVGAATDLFRGRAALYSAELGAESARAAADTRIHELSLEEGRAEAQLKLQESAQEIQQNQFAQTIAVEKLVQISGIAAQLAASTMSAINTSAGYGYGSNESATYGCNTSYTFSGSAS